MLGDNTSSQKKQTVDAVSENGIHELADYLSDRLRHDQFIALRKEIDTLLKQAKLHK